MFVARKGDSLKYQEGQKFSTYDQDMRGIVGMCAALYHGAWWYKSRSCHRSNLNGLYMRGRHPYLSGVGVVWFKWTGNYYSLRSVQMKIKPY